MTEEQKKEILNGISKNDEKWEGRPKYANDCDHWCSLCHISGKCLWQPFKLGDEIHDDWEYRKVVTWYEDYLKLFPKNYQKETCKIVVKETCQKILNEVRSHEGIEQLTKFYIAEIIKDLGVEVEV